MEELQRRQSERNNRSQADVDGLSKAIMKLSPDNKNPPSTKSAYNGKNGTVADEKWVAGVKRALCAQSVNLY